MWKYHFKASFRNLKRKSFFTFINILGIAIGLAAFFYIIQYVEHEKSYDNHLKDVEQIARVTIEKYRNGELIVSGAESYVATGPVLTAELPEVMAYTRTYNANLRMNAVISHEKDNGEKTAFKLTDYYYADSSFLSFFGYNLIKGDEKTALAEPNTAVITESLAQIYFGDEDPIGKILIYEDEDLIYDEHIITGVMADPPTNTHLPFRLLLSYNTFNSRENVYIYKDSWRTRKAYTYIKLHPDADLRKVEEKLVQIVDLHMKLPEERKEIMKLQPVADIHFTQELSDEPSPTSSRATLEILYLVAFLILGVAIVNYVNISTSSLMSRTGEVGVRKILGAHKQELITQFFIECSIIIVCGAVLAFFLTYFFWPVLNDLSGVTMKLSRLWQPDFMRLILAVILVSIFISGIIPAFIFASVNPVNALKGMNKSSGTSWLRLTLVVGQFTLSFCLLAATLIVYSQLRHMQSQELGIDIRKTLVVRTPGIMPSEDWDENDNYYRQYIDKMRQHSSINNATASLTIPGHLVPFRTGGHLQTNPENLITIRLNGVNDQFFETFDINFLAGRGFDEQKDMGKAVILTVAAIEKLGFDSPESAIGEVMQIPAFRMTCEIVGVVNDYRLESVKTEVEPMAFVFNSLINTNFFSFKIRENAEVPLDFVNTTWNKSFPGNPIEYFFMEDYFNQQYYQERRMSALFAVFGLLTVFLGGMGLLGLSTFMVKKHLKEIGIRKVLGSSVSQIFLLMTKKFLKLVVIASILGVPVVFYFGNQWLEQFSVRTDLHVWIFVIPALVIISVSFFSTGYQTLKAALVNPVNVIKDL